MFVTQLEQIGQSKVKVYIDDNYVFMLYQKEVDHYKLKAGTSITNEDYENIIEDTVYKRAKLKALSVLKFMDRTEYELRQKLADAGFTEDIINRTISYVSGYDYLNDERYASNYVRNKMSTKSRLAIRTELLHKGIDKDILDRIIQTEYENDELEEDAELTAIRKAVAKKTKSPGSLSPEQRQKLIASLYRKGFDISKIRQIIN